MADNETTIVSSGYYISVAAKMSGLHVQTLRYYEKAGIVEPTRSEGNIRLYSEQDIERIKRIKTLINELGVNLAGVDVIMRMAERMSQLEAQIQELESKPIKPKRARISELKTNAGRARKSGATLRKKAAND